MVFDTLDLHKPFVQVHDPASASMELEQVADGTPLHAVPAVPLANARFFVQKDPLPNAIVKKDYLQIKTSKRTP